MTIKQKSFREKENEKSRGKRRYRERLIQEDEAEKEIKEFDFQESEHYQTEEHPINASK